MQRFNLDFDDSVAYQAMKRLRANKIISFDKDFDRISDIKRIEPGAALGSSLVI